MRGKFITLEGGEGAGKSTQLRRIAESLRARGLEVVETREPGGSPGAEAIRDLLLTGNEQRWTAEAEALLFAAARSDHVAKVILPALERGAWVLCDRFIDSSIAYQGIAGALGEEAIRRLHHIGSHDLMPDRTFVLALPSGKAENRARLRDGAGGDRIGARGADYHAEVARAFADLARREPGRVFLVDADGPPDQVTERLMSQLGDFL